MIARSQRPRADSYRRVVGQPDPVSKTTPPHVESRAMRGGFSRVVNERPATRHDADLQPAGGGNKPRYGVLGGQVCRKDRQHKVGADYPALTRLTARPPRRPRKPLLIEKRDTYIASRSGSKPSSVKTHAESGVGSSKLSIFHTPVRRDDRSQVLCFQDCLVGPLQSGACYEVDARGIAFKRHSLGSHMDSIPSPAGR